jgi:hypothetical protein
MHRETIETEIADANGIEEHHPEKKRSVSSFISKVLLMLFGAVMTFVLLEVGLRVIGFSAGDIYRVDSATNLITLKPNKRLPVRSDCFQNTVQTNRYGFHSKDYEQDKPDGVYRIAVLGDSFVEAQQVPLEKTFPYLLENILNDQSVTGLRTEVLSFGISGTATYTNLRYLQAYALRFHPDLIINAFYFNDVQNDVYVSVRPDLSRQFDEEGNVVRTPPEEHVGFMDGIVSAVKKQLRNSAVIFSLYKKYHAIRAGYNSSPEEVSVLSKEDEEVISRYSADYQVNKKLSMEYQMLLAEEPPWWTDAWNVEERLLRELNDVAKENGSDFLLVSLSDGYRVHPELLDRIESFRNRELFDFQKPEERLQEIADRNHFPYLALNPLFKERAFSDDRMTVWPCDGHWNETGHEWAADEISKYLSEKWGLNEMP